MKYRGENMINETQKEVLKQRFEGNDDKQLLERMFKLYKKQCVDCEEEPKICLCSCIIEAGDISDELDRRWRRI